MHLTLLPALESRKYSEKPALECGCANTPVSSVKDLEERSLERAGEIWVSYKGLWKELLDHGMM